MGRRAGGRAIFAAIERHRERLGTMIGQYGMA